MNSGYEWWYGRNLRKNSIERFLRWLRLYNVRGHICDNLSHLGFEFYVPNFRIRGSKANVVGVSSKSDFLWTKSPAFGKNIFKISIYTYIIDPNKETMNHSSPRYF